MANLTIKKNRGGEKAEVSGSLIKSSPTVSEEIMGSKLHRGPEIHFNNSSTSDSLFKGIFRPFIKNFLFLILKQQLTLQTRISNIPTEFLIRRNSLSEGIRIPYLKPLNWVQSRFPHNFSP